MDTKKLRQKILDLAIRGKLVPQDPNDEPASVLLERIREEKKQMVKEGKLKAKDIKNDTIIFKGDDNLHYEKFQDGTVKCIEDEIPFEVPEGWEWCNLGLLFNHNTGKALNSSNTKGTLYTYITTSNVYWTHFELDELKMMPFTDEEIEKCTVKKGDLLVCEGGDIGRSAIWDYNEPIRIQNHIHRLRAFDKICTRFYYYVLYFYKSNGKINGQGIGLQGLSSNRLHSIIVPLPPIDEQIRITKEIDDFFNNIENIDIEINDVHELLNLSKVKILDLAIRGKLVPQDPNDEPASVLLERIRAEKEELIKQGKLKRDKKESIIYKGDDNSYFENINDTVTEINTINGYELPEGWAFARLKTICTKIIDGAHNPPKGLKEKSDYIMASSRNINNNEFYDLDNVRYLTKEDYEKENQRTIVTQGDILLTTVATLGRSCIYDGFPKNLTFQRSVTVISTLIDPKYLKIYFDAPIFQHIINNEATGTAQKGFYLNQLDDVIVPVPPLFEQRTIASIVNCFTSKLSEITASL